jgi:hypothetical protein
MKNFAEKLSLIDKERIIGGFLALFIFLITFIIFTASPVLERTDAVWSLYVSMSMVKEHNVDLDEYKDLLIMDYRLQEVDGHIYSYFPIGPSLIASPVVSFLEQFTLTKNEKKWRYYLLHHAPSEYILATEKLVASFLASIACTLMFLIAIRYLNFKSAVLVTLIFAFGTSLFSVASRGLWQHGPSILMLTTSIYIIELSQQKPWLISFSGIPLALSYITRPTNSISILILTIFIFINYRKEFIPYLLFLLTVLGCFAIYNYSIYQALLPPYFAANRIFISPYFAEAFVGNLISPSRGLLIWSPIFLLSGLGAIKSLRSFSIKDINLYFVVIIIAHWIAISSFPHWWGGASIGPRFFSDMIPYLTILLFPSFKWSLIRQDWLRPQTFLIVFLIAMSIFVHYWSANSEYPGGWNDFPGIDSNPQRLWDWSDIQFLRGVCKDPSQPAPRCWLE